MAEIVNVIVAFAVIILIFRWATSGESILWPAPDFQLTKRASILAAHLGSDTDRTAADTLGFRPKNVSQDMLDTISNMFPDIPIDNIRYDLLRTGSVELTTNKILERGFLDAPPPSYFQLYPRASVPPRPATASSTAVQPKQQKQESLIERFNLQDRLNDSSVIPESEVGGKSVWEDTTEKREANLRERKAKMILAARQRMLAAQKQNPVVSGSGSS